MLYSHILQLGPKQGPENAFSGLFQIKQHPLPSPLAEPHGRSEPSFRAFQGTNPFSTTCSLVGLPAITRFLDTVVLGFGDAALMPSESLASESILLRAPALPVDSEPIILCPSVDTSL